jgi:hypothetical protein
MNSLINIHLLSLRNWREKILLRSFQRRSLFRKPWSARNSERARLLEVILPMEGPLEDSLPLQEDLPKSDYYLLFHEH